MDILAIATKKNPNRLAVDEIQVVTQPGYLQKNPLRNDLENIVIQLMRICYTILVLCWWGIDSPCRKIMPHGTGRVSNEISAMYSIFNLLRGWK
jgi:hypothetical protein